MSEEQEKQEKIVAQVIEDEMKKSYLSYAMSVIVGRALPDVRDGLKPVHRRILYAMNDMGMRYNSSYKKCARIVGEVLGKYHPHGDSAVYDSLVRMAQDFSLRYMLVDGQGNFGSIDGDNAAAMRYTEAKLSKISDEMLGDIDKDTVEFSENFDGSLKEPTVLPAKLPNLLVNGSSGIAVGMATNIPPHNLREVSKAIISLIDNPDIETVQLMEHIQGPDFPTGGMIAGRSGILSAYSTGRGRVILKGVIDVEKKGEREIIVIRQIPYMVNKSALVEEIANCVKEKKIEGISDLRDESDRNGVRVVVELKKNFTPEITINQLYKFTRLQTTFGVIMVALVNNEPKVLNLKQVLSEYVKHRRLVVRRRTQFELDKSLKRAHILEGLLIALKDIDSVIKLIRAADNVDVARQKLIAGFELSEEQANAILDMRLSKLAKLERDKIENEHSDLKKLIAELQSILSDENEILSIIKKELEELSERFGDERKTQITDDEDLMEIEDLIEPEDVVVTITRAGYVKRISLDSYKLQKRGGKGIIATGTKEEDTVEELFVANTHSYLLVFTNKGRVHWLKVYQIPESSRQSKGRPIVNLVDTSQGETVESVIAVKEFKEDQYLVTATKNGVVKKTSLSAYSRPRKGGIIGLVLDEGDEVISVLLTSGDDELLIGTSFGFAVRFNEKDVRSVGRVSRGVRGISLREGDKVIGMIRADKTSKVLTITENGYGKKTPIDDYRFTKRGGKGVINIKCSERNGKVVTIKNVRDDQQLMLISRSGIIIRTNVLDISTIGRNTQGVRIMRLGESDKVVSATRINEQTQ